MSWGTSWSGAWGASWGDATVQNWPAWGQSWNVAWDDTWGPVVATVPTTHDGGGGLQRDYPPLIPMPLELRRIRTRIAEMDEELLLELALNVMDEDMLILAALTNFEPE